MPAPTLKNLAGVAAVFRAEPKVLAAWLFGSVAAGRATPLSDLDFAILLREDSPQGLDRLVLLDRLAQSLADVLGVSENEIDVVALNEQGLVFQYEVLRTGRLIHESDRKARELFVWRVLRHYLDFRPTLEIYDRARAQADRAARARLRQAVATKGASG